MDKIDKCSKCGQGVIELVPLHDDDQKHTGKMLCFKCKREARENGEPLTSKPIFRLTPVKPLVMA